MCPRTQSHGQTYTHTLIRTDIPIFSKPYFTVLFYTSRVNHHIVGLFPFYFIHRYVNLINLLRLSNNDKLLSHLKTFFFFFFTVQHPYCMCSRDTHCTPHTADNKKILFNQRRLDHRTLPSPYTDTSHSFPYLSPPLSLLMFLFCLVFCFTPFFLQL